MLYVYQIRLQRMIIVFLSKSLPIKYLIYNTRIQHALSQTYVNFRALEGILYHYLSTRLLTVIHSSVMLYLCFISIKIASHNLAQLSFYSLWTKLKKKLIHYLINHSGNMDSIHYAIFLSLLWQKYSKINHTHWTVKYKSYWYTTLMM